MIKGVVFDVGGTMHVSEKDSKKSLAFSLEVLDILAQRDIALAIEPTDFYSRLMVSSEEYKARSEATGEELSCLEIWRDFFLKPYQVDGEKLKPVAETLCTLFDSTRQNLRPRPHLKETVVRLHQEGFKLGVISNIISLNFVPNILVHYGIAEYMGCVILSSATGKRKPWPDMFQIAEKELGLKAQSLAYVGDTLSRDVIGVRNAGWRLMIQIENPSVAHRDKKVQGLGYAPDYLIQDLAEIPDIIAKENAKTT